MNSNEGNPGFETLINFSMIMLMIIVNLEGN